MSTYPFSLPKPSSARACFEGLSAICGIAYRLSDEISEERMTLTLESTDEETARLQALAKARGGDVLRLDEALAGRDVGLYVLLSVDDTYCLTRW